MRSLGVLAGPAKHSQELEKSNAVFASAIFAHTVVHPIELVVGAPPRGSPHGGDDSFDRTYDRSDESRSIFSAGHEGAHI